MAHVPAFTCRPQYSAGTSIKLSTACGHWGTGPDGKGINMYGKLLSQLRDVQLELGELGLLSQAADVDSESNVITDIFEEHLRTLP